MSGVEVYTDSDWREGIDQAEPFRIENAFKQGVIPAGELPLCLGGVPQDIHYVALQGFNKPQGVVGFHRESKKPPVAEIYFPLVGDVLAIVEKRIRGSKFTNLTETRMRGQFTRDQIEEATFFLQQGEEGPELQVRVGREITTLKPAVIIPAGNAHGTLAVVDGEESPLFFALKLKKAA